MSSRKNQGNRNPRTPTPNQQPSSQQPDMGDPNILNNPSFYSYLNNMQIPSPMSPNMYYNPIPQQHPMPGFGMWNTQQQYGFHAVAGSSIQQNGLFFLKQTLFF